MTEINNQPQPAATGRVGGHVRVAGYVPSAEAVEAVRGALAPLMTDTRRVADYPEHIREAHRAWSGDFTSRAKIVQRLFIEAALAAAVPVEVTRLFDRIDAVLAERDEARGEVARLLGEVRALADDADRVLIERFGEPMEHPGLIQSDHLRDAIRRTGAEPTQGLAGRLVEKVRSLNSALDSLGRAVHDATDTPLGDGENYELAMERMSTMGYEVMALQRETARLEAENADLRAVLDTVGVPAQVDEAATGGQSS